MLADDLTLAMMRGRIRDLEKRRCPNTQSLKSGLLRPLEEASQDEFERNRVAAAKEQEDTN